MNKTVFTTGRFLLYRYIGVSLAAPSVMIMTALCSMGAFAGGGGSRSNGTAINSTAVLTTAIAQLRVNKRTGNHSHPTAPIPIHRNPGQHNQPKLPVPFPLSNKRKPNSLWPGRQLTPINPITKGSQKPNTSRSHKPATGQSKGSYSAREAKVDPPYQSKGRGTHKTKTSHKTKNSYTARNSKWQLTTGSYLHDYDDSPLLSDRVQLFDQTGDEVHSRGQRQASTPPENGDNPLFPPVETPTVVLDHVERNNTGNTLHLILNNSHSFIEQCEPFVYKIKDGEYQTLTLNLTTNNTGFTISDGEFYADGQEGPNNPVLHDVIDIVALCRNTPAQGSLTRIGQTTDINTAETSPDYQLTTSNVPANFAPWYLKRPEYRDQPCENRFGKMILRAGKSSVAPGESVPLQLLKPFDIGDNRGYCVWDSQPNIALNDRIITPAYPQDRITEHSYFRYGLDLSLSCERMSVQELWKGGDQLDITLFRRPTYTRGIRDQVTIHLPLETSPALPPIETLRLDRTNKRLNIRFQRAPAQCFNVAVIMRSTNPDRFEDEQALVCKRSAQEISFPLSGFLNQGEGLADLIITLVPEWVPAGVRKGYSFHNLAWVIVNSDKVRTNCLGDSCQLPATQCNNTKEEDSFYQPECTDTAAYGLWYYAGSASVSCQIPTEVPANTTTTTTASTKPSLPSSSAQSMPGWLTIVIPTAIFLDRQGL